MNVCVNLIYKCIINFAEEIYFHKLFQIVSKCYIRVNICAIC